MAFRLWKFTLGDDTRRWTSPQGDLNLDLLKAKVKEVYGLADGAELHLKYQDVDGDKVTLACESDVKELLMQNLELVRVAVTLKQDNKADKKKAKQAQEKDKKAQEKDKKALKRAAKDESGGSKKCNKSSDEDDEGNWTPWRVDKFTKRISGFLPRMATDSDACSKVVKMLNRCYGKVNENGAREVLATIQKAARGDPAVMEKLRLLANEPVALGLEEEVPAGSQAMALQAISDEDFVPVVVHPGVVCDGCGMTPVSGKRYKSTSRDDFDLCSNCFVMEGKPWSEDTFMMIERPVPWKGCRRGGRGSGLGARGPGGFGLHFCGPAFGMPHGGPMMNPLHRQHPHHHHGGPHPHPHHHHGGPHPHPHPHPHPAQGFAPPPPYGPPPAGPAAPHAPFAPAPAPEEGPWNGKERKAEARFVEDISVPDGTCLVPGQAFTKTWRMRNSGELAWDPASKGIVLVHVGGDGLSAPPRTPVCVNGAPGIGEEVDVSVDLIAPHEPGRYVAYFRLAALGAKAPARFGQRVWVQIQVTRAETDAASQPRPVDIMAGMAGLKVLHDNPAAGPSAPSMHPAAENDGWVDVNQAHSG